MMDCLEAQRLVSEKIDSHPVDPGELETAKEHCRACPECAAYVRAMVKIQGTGLPEPAVELHARIMSAVARATAAGSVAPIVTKNARPMPSSSDGRPVSFARLRERLTDPRNRRTAVTWSTAAAAVLLVTVVVAAIGVRQIFSPPQTSSKLSAPVLGTREVAAPQNDTATGGDQQDTALMAAPTTTAPASAPSCIVISGAVYRLSGPDTSIDARRLKPAGTTWTALDTGAEATNRGVFGLQDSARVYVADGAGGYLGFDRVTRSLKKHVFVLQSGPLAGYGQWPTLPDGVKRPTTSDGSPEYAPAGSDDAGVAVYGPGGATDHGFMVPPGTESSDPAGGNPDWTWWTPVR